MDRPLSDRLSNWALGVAGEAGEVADYMKKVLHHGHALDIEKLTKELGDVCWYVAVLANEAGIKFSTVLEENEKKLRARYPDGFTSRGSIERRDEE